MRRDTTACTSTGPSRPDTWPTSGRSRTWDGSTLAGGGKGAAPCGYVRAVVAVEDLERFQPVRVWKRGRLVAEEGRSVDVPRSPMPDWMRGSVRGPHREAGGFRIQTAGRGRVIGVEPGQIVTRALVENVTHVDGQAMADPSRDLAKIAVVERHRGTGRIGLGFVRGFDLKRGAMASTHAHDAHNVVAVGVDAGDMATAVNRLAETGGGQVAVAAGAVLGEVSCPFGGLLSDRPAEEVAALARAMGEAAEEMGGTLPSPFMTMSFLALSVVPELKLTDRGLVDVDRFELVPLQV